MTENEYRALPGVSSSQIKTLASRGRAGLWQSIYRPTEPTAAMALGTLAHCFAFEPAEVAARFAVSPDCDRRTKEGKAIYADFVTAAAGKIVVSQKDYDTAKSVAESYWRAVGVREGAEFEVAEFSPESKARADHWEPSAKTIYDLKTCSDATPAGIKRAFWSLRYDLQAGHYAPLFGAEKFVFVFVQTSAPYAASLVEFSGAELSVAISGAAAWAGEVQKLTKLPEDAPEWRPVTSISVGDCPPWIARVPETECSEIDEF